MRYDVLLTPELLASQTEAFVRLEEAALRERIGMVIATPWRWRTTRFNLGFSWFGLAFTILGLVLVLGQPTRRGHSPAEALPVELFLLLCIGLFAFMIWLHRSFDRSGVKPRLVRLTQRTARSKWQRYLGRTPRRLVVSLEDGVLEISGPAALRCQTKEIAAVLREEALVSIRFRRPYWRRRVVTFPSAGDATAFAHALKAAPAPPAKALPA